jgi:hypothetical protein
VNVEEKGWGGINLRVGREEEESDGAKEGEISLGAWVYISVGRNAYCHQVGSIAVAIGTSGSGRGARGDCSRMGMDNGHVMSDGGQRL